MCEQRRLLLDARRPLYFKFFEEDGARHHTYRGFRALTSGQPVCYHSVISSCLDVAQRLDGEAAERSSANQFLPAIRYVNLIGEDRIAKSSASARFQGFDHDAILEALRL